MPVWHRHQRQYLSAHVVGGSLKCRGSTRDRAPIHIRQGGGTLRPKRARSSSLSR